MNDIRTAFDRDAVDYDAGRRRLIPCFTDFYALAVALLPPGRLRVLDLGAGTGLLSEGVLQTRPGSRMTLMDVAPAMLEIARQRLAGREGEVDIQVADYITVDLGEGYDAVVSALSIHHLEDPEKRRLFGRIFAALKPGGIFVNADQIAGPTTSLRALYHQRWLDAVRHAGTSEQELALAFDRMKHDRFATLDDQTAWLKEAGFIDVDCFYRQFSFAVFGGWKPAES
jgi:tRNA (cmo5U34)-methyltransferase